MHNYCVILAGGSGTRIWPMSREGKPKQFLNSTLDGKTFLRATYERMARIFDPSHILVVSLAKYRNLVCRSIPELPAENLLLEPFSRNSAPSVAFAAYTLLKRDPHAVMVATPADHVIKDEDLFDDSIRRALEFASCEDVLVTLGIIPTRPDTNFGYIQKACEPSAPGQPVKIKTFTEKPPAELAEVFVASGEFLWNSGIFIWQARTICNEFERFCPELTKQWEGWEAALGTPQEAAFIGHVYTEAVKISVDYAVMEKSDKAWVFPVGFGWADIGTYEALYTNWPNRDADGNVGYAAGDLIAKELSGCLVYSSVSDKLIALRGLENYLVVDTGDVLLICPRDEDKLKEFSLDLAMPEYEKYR
ncbi:MAG: mannose-1-phosphate guanylyltransferase [Bacteroidales bacterium]|nr:mannose-1-phosphate guanylyltransferase [Bacteroidales bacterium]